MKHRLRTLTLLAFTALSLSAATNTLRVYYLGNSVTDTVRYGELAKLAATRGVKLHWGRTMIPGAPLEWLYTHPNEAGSYLVGCTYFATLLKQSPVGLSTAPYGRIDPALAETIQKTVWQVVAAHPDAGVGAK